MRKISQQRLFSPARCSSPWRPASRALAAAKGNPIALEFLTQGEFFSELRPAVSVYARKERERHAITIGTDTNGHYVHRDARRVAVSIGLIRNGNALQKEPTL